MTVDSIKNGIVIDHIQAGEGMKIYQFLNLESCGCPVALMINVTSRQMGHKDIIKVDGELGLDLNILGFIDPSITIDVIENEVCVKKYHPELPTEIREIVRCKNPRCITTVEQELPQIFRLTDRKNKVYRCVYCDGKAQ